MTSSKSASVTGPKLDPAVQKYLNKIAAMNPPPIYTLSPQDARNALAAAQLGNYAMPAADIEQREFPVSGDPKDALVRVRIVRPKGTEVTLPAIMYFHGGGWIMGDFSTHERLVRELAVGANAAVVFVEYDPAPAAKYPAQIEQAYGATCYVAKHAQELGWDAKRIAVVGDSAGGNMATIVAGMVKKTGPKLIAQILFYPVVDANFETASYNEFAEGPWLTKTAMKWFFDAYVPEAESRKSIGIAPLQASLEELQGLPPTLVITAENDVLRDEGEAYAHKLAQAGVPVTAVRYLGTMHDFVMINELAETTATRSALALAISTLRVAFEQSP